LRIVYFDRESEGQGMADKQETIKRVKSIAAAREIGLDGNAYIGKYLLNDVDSIQNFILDNLRSKPYTNLDTGDKIIISSKSARKLASHYKDGEAYQKTIAHIPLIIENMMFLDGSPADKSGAKYGEYKYYVTSAKIDGKQHTVLSAVGHDQNNVYYDQRVFEGSPQNVFKRVKNATDRRYERLNKILKDIEESDWSPISVVIQEYPNHSSYTSKQ
jgi:hypothetical protein